MTKKTRKIVTTAVVAGLYATLTLSLAPISYAQIQLDYLK